MPHPDAPSQDIATFLTSEEARYLSVIRAAIADNIHPTTLLTAVYELADQINKNALDPIETLELLRICEWGADGLTCPCCHVNIEFGHHPGCRLAKALAQAPDME